MLKSDQGMAAVVAVVGAGATEHIRWVYGDSREELPILSRAQQDCDAAALLWARFFVKTLAAIDKGLADE